MRSLALSVEARDSHTWQHCRRLGNLARQLAYWMYLNDIDGAVFKRAVYLHDIGKIGMQDTILLKPKGLSQSEWDVMHEHPAMGEKILRPIEFLEPVLPVVRHHHERWDGGGYPDGLAGERIPVAERAFQIADAYDALTSERPYRPGMAPAAALGLVSREAEDGKFDTGIARLFVEEMAGYPIGEMGNRGGDTATATVERNSW